MVRGVYLVTVELFSEGSLLFELLFELRYLPPLLVRHYHSSRSEESMHISEMTDAINSKYRRLANQVISTVITVDPVIRATPPFASNNAGGGLN